MQHMNVNELDKMQRKLAENISLQNCFTMGDIRLVAGVDVAYWSQNGSDYGVCCIQVIDHHSKKTVAQAEHVGEVAFPYIAGYLAYRELPLVLEAAKKLKVCPDLYMFDGNGYLHHRHMGIATQASFLLKKPTIGVAKSYLKINQTDFVMPENRAGAYTEIVINGELFGRALRTRKDVKPVFVSSGNWVDIDTATSITMHFVEKDSRIPITTRYADLATHKARKKYQN